MAGNGGSGTTAGEIINMVALRKAMVNFLAIMKAEVNVRCCGYAVALPA
jgi:hypothetical protein